MQELESANIKKYQTQISCWFYTWDFIQRYQSEKRYQPTVCYFAWYQCLSRYWYLNVPIVKKGLINMWVCPNTHLCTFSCKTDWM